MRSEIKSLTGLRGLAACWVMLGHYGLDRWPASDLVRRLGARSYFAVDIFMILSGFVLAMVYEKNFTPRLTGKAYAMFLYHRLARIYPIYGLTTALCLALAWLASGFTWCDTCAMDIGANVLMVQGWAWPADSLNGPAWSLSVEWLLNLAFPVFVLLMLRTPIRLAGLLAVVTFAGLAGLTLLLGPPSPDDPYGAISWFTPPNSLVRCAATFALGVYCWRLRSDAGGVAWLGGTPAMLAIVTGVAVILFRPSLDLPFVLLACGLVLGCSFERSWVARCLASPVPHWLGLISYSLYMWHMVLLPVRAMALRLLIGASEPGSLAIPDALSAVVCVIIALGISALSFTWFERPAQRWLRGLIAPRRLAPAIAE
jgi:peptidoglycan/LPS O-acetylase OafA/YrhL